MKIVLILRFNYTCFSKPMHLKHKNVKFNFSLWYSGIYGIYYEREF